MKPTLALSILLALLLQGCIPLIFIPDDDDGPSCKKPIYMDYKTLREKPAILPAQEIEKAGKIYIWGDTLFVNEPNKGIHVIDNSDPAHPKNRHFIDLPGNIDIAVKDGYLYADSFIDLVVLDVNDIDHISRVHRQEEVFAYDPFQVLRADQERFDYCYPDSEKGVVIGFRE